MKPGDILNEKYRIEELLGQGGMGAVYLAENQDVGRKVAIKVMRPEFAANGEALARFRREARAAGAIGHPGIVDVFDMGTSAQGAPFIVMEHLQGQTLRQRSAMPPPLTVAQAVTFVIEVLEVLEAAHAAGVIHRDLKPDNLFVVEKPRAGVKILDFGVSKFREGPAASVTQTGQVMGTPLYMAPEQARGSRDAGVASDLYSMGAILYEVLSGRPPFPGESYTEVLAKLLTETLPPLAEIRSDLSPALRGAVERLLQKDPAARFSSAAETAAALRQCLDETSPSLLGRALSAGVPSLGKTTPSARAISPLAAVAPARVATARRRPVMAGVALLCVVATAGAALFWRSSSPLPPAAPAIPVTPPLPLAPATAVLPPSPPTPPALRTPPSVAPAPAVASSAPERPPPAPAAKRRAGSVAAHASSKPVEPQAVASAAPVPPTPAPAGATQAPPATAPVVGVTPVRFQGFVDEHDQPPPPAKALPHRRYAQAVTLYQVGGRTTVSFAGPPPCRLYLTLRTPTSFTVDSKQSCPFTEHGVVHQMLMSGKATLDGSSLAVELSGAVDDGQLEFHSSYSGTRVH
jgi:serine/threonine protein kinase